MTDLFAKEEAHKRMEEMGYTKADYYVKYQHFVLQPNEHKDIEAYNQFYFLIDAPDNINVISDFGLYDLSFDRTNAQDYEHQGFISIHNYSKSINHIRFLQVITKYKSQSSS